MINILNFKPFCHFTLRSCMYCSVNYNFWLLLDSKTIGLPVALKMFTQIFSTTFRYILHIKQQNKLVLFCTYSSKAAKSFEQQATTEEKTNSNSKKENQPKKQEEEANKRLLSNSSSSSVSNPPKRKTDTDEQELAYLFDYTSEDNPDSILDFTDFKLFAEDCCHELI